MTVDELVYPLPPLVCLYMLNHQFLEGVCQGRVEVVAWFLAFASIQP